MDKRRGKKELQKNLHKNPLENPEKILLIDDETYVPFHPKNVLGNPYYHETVTGKVYLEECLKKKFILFIQKHRKIESVIF